MQLRDGQCASIAYSYMYTHLATATCTEPGDYPSYESSVKLCELPSDGGCHAQVSVSQLVNQLCSGSSCVAAVSATCVREGGVAMCSFAKVIDIKFHLEVPVYWKILQPQECSSYTCLCATVFVSCSLSVSYFCVPCLFIRIHEHERTTKKLSDRLKEVEEQLKTLTLTHQELTDEHHTLQLTCNSTEKKLKETFQENDRLVSVN